MCIVFLGSRAGGWSWQVFVASMFIGLGLGELLGRPDVGVLLGMGMGFILATLIRIERRVVINIPRSFGAILTMTAGVFFILSGLTFLDVIPRSYLRYFGGIGLMFLGIMFIVFSSRAIRRR
ncbi:MAG: hypothetical protein NDF54_11690 [archaeon GB-1867-035]|nr:hypothetical protein [Candidatus Culexmicrobium profundum]